METDTPFSGLEKLRMYNLLSKIKFPYQMNSIQDNISLFWRDGMFKKGRLARFYSLTWRVVVARGMKGADTKLDSDEMKDALPHVAHELTHAYHCEHNIIIHFVGKWLPVLPHKFYGCLKNEYAVNEYYGRSGAGQIE